ncbi:ABC transporter substrate-binding protein [Acinetobacter dispersus]|uniref:ABC transporter substrate-binding protein n=1 Tax=Acinetobacter dispersus TaxID=70348 RepID=UPI001F4B2F56|nr:ABC transporter substrate-binding protein [Acinetobacter dispersus]MCH7393843.1 ABC transporter substrate-binding protein [Acinetobacter dispersus]
MYRQSWRKQLLGLSGIMIMSLVLLGCVKQESKLATVDGLESLEFKYLGSPGIVTPLELAEDLGYLAPIKLSYQGVSTGGPQGIQSALSGDSDISSPSFAGSAVKMVASGVPGTVVIAAYGTFDDPFAGYYVLENSQIHSARDLIGKKVGTNILGAQVEYMLKTYLKKGGLSPEEINQVTLVVLPPGSSEQALRNGHVDLAPLTGPSIERGGVRRLYRDYDLVGDLTTGTYVMANRYIAEHPNTTRKVVTGIAKAIEWSRQQPRDQVIARFEHILAKRKRPENSAMLKYWTQWGIPSNAGRFENDDFTIWVNNLISEGQLKQNQIDYKKIYSNQYNAYSQN